MSDTSLRVAGLDRRAFLTYFSGIGLGSTLLPGALWARALADQEITARTVECAEEIAGLAFTHEEREMMVQGLERQRESLQRLREMELPNSVPPAVHFDPLPPGAPAPPPRRSELAPPLDAGTASLRPADLDDLAFMTVSELAHLMKDREVSSVELTRMYLDRLTRYDPVLHAVVTLTEERALRQARARDDELARGIYRGPLHGIPWGAKDLLAVRGYPTTWGAEPYRDQMLDEDAAVVQRLDAAGAVLVAKLSLGELAMGDVWYGGMTRNPWNAEQGSSGSSAGPGSATAAGLVGFAIGSETLGSISSPSTRNGVTGLRPTFGRVPRTGAMALSWTMDKLGPMCRSAQDCALVLHYINGADRMDPAARDVAFRWDPSIDPKSLRIGYFQAEFDRDEDRYPSRSYDLASLEVLRSLGAELIPVELPEADYGAMRIVLTAEAAAAFDDLTRSGRDELLAQQRAGSWPNTFRTGRFIPAVEYINANRARTLAMQRWRDLFTQVDVVVTPTSGAQLTATNLTGHPAVIVPNGFRDNGTPVSLTFLGGLFQDAAALAVAHAYQKATDFHRRYPTLDGFLQNGA